MSPAALEARGLVKSFGALTATQDVDLRLETGRIQALIGPNGAGKTTLIGQLAGDIRPDRGRIYIDGRDVTALDPARRARAGLARSWQVSSLFSSFSAEENVQAAIIGRQGRLSPLKDARRDRDLAAEALGFLDAVGAADLATRPVAALAHGQRRQVELAMVLALQPRVVLLDEPMAGLGAAETRALTPVVAGLRAGRAVLLVEHDMSVVFELADTISVLVGGRIIASGPPDRIRSNAEVRTAYLSEEA